MATEQIPVTFALSSRPPRGLLNYECPLKSEGENFLQVAMKKQALWGKVDQRWLSELLERYTDVGFLPGQRKCSECNIMDTNELFSSKDTNIRNSLNNNALHCNLVT